MMKQHDQYQIGLNDLPSELREVARIIGLGAAIKLIHEFSGTQIYVPKYETIVRPVRDRAIKAEFDGSNIKTLAGKYGMSTRHLRAILKKQKKL